MSRFIQYKPVFYELKLPVHFSVMLPSKGLIVFVYPGPVSDPSCPMSTLSHKLGHHYLSCGPAFASMTDNLFLSILLWNFAPVAESCTFSKFWLK